MFLRWSAMVFALWLVACGDDVSKESEKADAATADKTSSATKVNKGSSGCATSNNTGGAGGATMMRRSPTACTVLPDAEKQVSCGGQQCPLTAKHETDPCFVPCCVTFEGAERCGFRGTSSATAAFTTDCVMPA